MQNNIEKNEGNIYKPKNQVKHIIIIWVILLMILSYSFITETIMYVFKKGLIINGITGILGFLMLVGGVATFAYGGYLFWINTNFLFQCNEKLINNIKLLRNPETSKEVKKLVRKENINFLLEAWKPTFIYFELALLFILCGAIIVNISDGTIII